MKKRIAGVLAAVTALSIIGGCAKNEMVKENNDSSKLTFSVSLPDNGNQYVIRSSNINEDEWVKKLNERFNANITF